MRGAVDRLLPSERGFSGGDGRRGGIGDRF